MGIALIIIGFILILLPVIYAIMDVRALKRKNEKAFTKKNLRNFIISAVVAGAGGVLTNVGYSQTGQWAVDAGHWVMLIIGGFLFYAAVYCWILSFYARYWFKDLIEDQRKDISLTLILSSVMLFGAFLLAGEGMAPYLTYPLVKGFAINNQGWVWTTPNYSPSGGLQIPWYGVLIVLGAFLAYKLSDNNFYKKYGFKITLIKEAYYSNGEDAIYMIKEVE